MLSIWEHIRVITSVIPLVFLYNRRYYMLCLRLSKHLIELRTVVTWFCRRDTSLIYRWSFTKIEITQCSYPYNIYVYNIKIIRSKKVMYSYMYTNIFQIFGTSFILRLVTFVYECELKNEYKLEYHYQILRS